MVGAFSMYLVLALIHFACVVNCNNVNRQHAQQEQQCPKMCQCLGDYIMCMKVNLVRVPEDIPGWIKHLNLNNNHIQTIKSNVWETLPKLTKITLNKNKIQTLSKDCFNNLGRLEILELSRNQISNFDSLTFKSLENLTELKLRRNKISDLRDGSFFGLGNIKLLYLDYNNIQIVTKGWMYGLDTLRELSLSNNIINDIDKDAWEFSQVLMELDLSYNRLRSLKKDTLRGLTNLKRLVINHNNITSIEENTFSHTPNLKILELNNNKISWTIEDANGVFYGLYNLTKFYVASNNIKSINKQAFVGLTHVNHLDLNDNNITSIQEHAFAEMPQLTDLILNTSSLLCDCNLRWFYDWLIVKKIQSHTICAYPEWLRNQPLISVPPTNFTCDDLPKPRLIAEPEPEIMALKGENISLTCRAVSSSPSRLVFQWKKDNVELTRANVTSTDHHHNRQQQRLQKQRQHLGKKLHNNNSDKKIHSSALKSSDNQRAMSNNNDNNQRAVINNNDDQRQLMNSDNQRPTFNDQLRTVFNNNDQRRPMLNDEQRAVLSNDGRAMLNSNEHAGFNEDRVVYNDGTMFDEDRTVFSDDGGTVYDEDRAVFTNDRVVFDDEKVINNDRAGFSDDVLFTDDSSESDKNAVLSDDEALIASGNSETSATLNIIRVQHSDAGKYQCVVTNSFGTTYSQKSTISVLIFPRFVKLPANVTVRAGTTARLDCAAHGEPQPEIAWQKDGGNDFPAARERRMHVMPSEDQFFIFNAKRADTGVYTCTAHNAAGSVVHNATLTVEEVPYFAKPMEDKEVMEGESVVIQCMAGGAPKPLIQWLKDMVPISATERHFFTAEDQLMIIVDTVKTDTGAYTCQLSNRLGNETGQCTLIVKPELISQSDMLGIIIITVVCCAVGTSIVWVVIIYQTRKKSLLSTTTTAGTGIPPLLAATCLDHDDTTTTAANHNATAGGIHLQYEGGGPESGLLLRGPGMGLDDVSEHSSCKDSGTGDSARRSSDDLVAVDEYTLIVADTTDSPPTLINNKVSSMRPASLVYLLSPAGDVTTGVSDLTCGDVTVTPLLHRVTTDNYEHCDNTVGVNYEQHPDDTVNHTADGVIRQMTVTAEQNHINSNHDRLLDSDMDSDSNSNNSGDGVKVQKQQQLQQQRGVFT